MKKIGFVAFVFGLLIIGLLFGGCGKALKDTTAPSVLTTTPTDGATSIAVNSKVTATFSEAMDSTSITISTVQLSSPGGSVSRFLAYDSSSKTVTVTPKQNLAANTTYTATISAGVKDSAGNNMSSNHSWSFTTSASSDTTAPTVLSTTPTNGATSIYLNSKVIATFSEAMDPTTIVSSAFSLSSSGGSVSGVVAYNATSNTLTFTPDQNLTSSITYTASIATSVKDLAGNALATAKTWSFTTGTTADTTAPTVSTVSPANAATAVALNSTITATFDKDMDPATISTSSVTISSSLGALAGTVSYSSKTVTFTPTNLLANNYTYTATISTTVKDTSGNNMAANYSWSFTTKAYSASVLYSKDGNAAGDNFGNSICGLGNLDGVGTNDIIVGAPGKNSDTGAAYILSGSDGTPFSYSSIAGATSGDLFGYSVSGSGDLDGNGNNDIIVGAWGKNSQKGAVYMYSGTTGTAINTPISGLGAGHRFGWSVFGNVDVNNSSTDDILAGAPMANSNKGYIEVYHTIGLSLHIYSGLASGNFYGYAVSGTGDLNADGLKDYIVSAPGKDSVYIYHGISYAGQLSYSPLTGQTSGDNFGWAVSGTSDLTGDGVNDIIVGAPNRNSGAGAVYAYNGSSGTLLFTLDGVSSGDNFGYTVAGISDVNGDGKGDILVGAPKVNSWTGAAYIYSGSDGTKLLTINGETAGDWFGNAVSTTGDLNGDGKCDFVIGAYERNSSRGAIYVYTSE